MPMHDDTAKSPRRAGFPVRWLLIVGLLPAAFTARSTAADPQTLAEYQRQFQALDKDDIDGHVKLALWCRDQEAWDLLTTQSRYVLTLDDEHRLANLLLELANSKSGAAAPTATPDPAAPAGPAPTGTPGKAGLLTADQVQELRRKELRLDGSERVQVDLRNKVDERFLEYFITREGIPQQTAIEFKKLNPLHKAQFILGKMRQYDREALPESPFKDEFSQDVIIKNDPLIFKEFVTRVWPIIERGCATSGCHSGPKGSEPLFYNERRMTDEMHYSNYLILHDYKRGDARMLNRDFPKDSLLLVFGQPVAGNQSTAHPTQIRPLFQSSSDKQYQIIGRWITVLGVPTPDYGFTAGVSK